VKAARIGVGAFVAHNVDKDAVAAFFVQAINGAIKDLIVIHFNQALLFGRP